MRTSRFSEGQIAMALRQLPSQPNELWAMDSMHDTLANGETLRVLTAIDICTLACVALVAAKG